MSINRLVIFYATEEIAVPLLKKQQFTKKTVLTLNLPPIQTPANWGNWLQLNNFTKITPNLEQPDLNTFGNSEKNERIEK